MEKWVGKVQSFYLKRAYEKEGHVMIEGPGHVPLNEVAANVRLAKSL